MSTTGNIKSLSLVGTLNRAELRVLTICTAPFQS
jgi:hypothetical protein